MRLSQRMIALMLCATALAMPLAGCAGGGVFYDPYRQDYHRWSLDEDRLYRQWETRTHRNHMDFQRRPSGDQRAYWGWRHR
jgi:hypothetical protein